MKVAIAILSLYLSAVFAAPQFEHLVIPYEDGEAVPSKSVSSKPKFNNNEPEIIVGSHYSFDADGNEEFLFVNVGSSYQVASPKKNDKKAAFISNPGTPLIISQRRHW